jgi:hypothetical protein
LAGGIIDAETIRIARGRIAAIALRGLDGTTERVSGIGDDNSNEPASATLGSVLAIGGEMGKAEGRCGR